MLCCASIWIMLYIAINIVYTKGAWSLCSWFYTLMHHLRVWSQIICCWTAFVPPRHSLSCRMLAYGLCSTALPPETLTVWYQRPRQNSHPSAYFTTTVFTPTLRCVPLSVTSCRLKPAFAFPTTLAAAFQVVFFCFFVCQNPSALLLSLPHEDLVYSWFQGAFLAV